MRLITLMVALLAMAGAGDAAVITVERDGSGDFTVIQAAVNAAASGDTILIGPGRFDEGEIVTTPGWTEYVRILVRQAELTIIGSGKTETIIGPYTPWDPSIGADKAIEAGLWWGNQRLNVEGVGIENVGHGIDAFPMPEMHLQDMRFEGNNHSVIVGNGSNAYIDNCEFVDALNDGYQVLTYNNTNFNVTNSSFSVKQLSFCNFPATIIPSPC